MFMKSFVFCFVVCLFFGDAVYGYTDAELAAVRQTVSVIMDDNHLVQSLPNDANCRDNVKAFLLGALPIVLPEINNNNLAAALTTVAVVEGELVTLDGKVIIEVVQNSTNLTPEACRPLCEMTKASCGCDEKLWENLVKLTGNNEETAKTLINTFVESCLASVPTMSFESTLVDRETCSETYSTEDFICE